MKRRIDIDCHRLLGWIDGRDSLLEENEVVSGRVVRRARFGDRRLRELVEPRLLPIHGLLAAALRVVVSGGCLRCVMTLANE